MQTCTEPLRAFYRRVIGNPEPGDDKIPATFETAYMAEYTAAVQHLGKVRGFLLEAGVECTLKGGIKPDSRWTVLRAETGESFTVRFKAAKTRPQAVTGTSRDAYHTLDFSSERGRVADCILRMSAGDVTRAEIAYQTGLEKSSVSGRVNELFGLCESGPLKLRDAFYTLEHTQKRISDFPGAPAVSVQAFRFLQVDANHKQPAPAVQTELF